MAADPVALLTDLDPAHVAKEMEEAGNEQRFAMESNLIQASIHLIKPVAKAKQCRPTPSWLRDPEGAAVQGTGHGHPQAMVLDCALLDTARGGARVYLLAPP
jgi:Domain of unknown function DUF29